jgi:hypothetical protein
MMQAEIKPIFGRVPADAPNLEIVGEFPRRVEIWPHATVWPQSGVVRRADGVVETESIWVSENLKDCGDYNSIWSGFPKAKTGTYFNLSLYWWSNYYHWCCDILTRLLWALPQLSGDARIVLPPRLSAWQKRSLELVGLSASRCVQFSGRRPWKTERLIWASPLAMTGDHEPNSLAMLRTIILQKLRIEPAKPGWRKLYLSRKNVSQRSVINETELLPLLVERGYEVVDCGALDFDSQVKLFTEAGTIVGPHGAAFANILWAAPGARVFEVFEPGSVRRCYWSLCRSLGHRHTCAIGDVAGNHAGEMGIHVPVREFTEALQKLEV